MTFNAGATREVSHAGSSIHISSRAGAHLNGLSRGGDAHMRRTGLLGAGVAAKQHTPHGVRAARPFPRCHNKSSSDGSPPPVESNGAASPHPGRSGSGLVSATDRSNDCAANRPISIDGKSGNDYGVLSRGQGGLQKCFLFSASQHRLRLHCITSVAPVWRVWSLGICALLAAATLRCLSYASAVLLSARWIGFGCEG
jgi:hypothetical protein